MTSQGRNTKAEILINEFIKDLDRTAIKIDNLLNEIKESKISFASTKSELTYLINSVQDLSLIIRGGGSTKSILTRLALVENSIENIYKYINKDYFNEIELVKKVAILEQKIETILGYVNDRTKDAEILKISEADKIGKWKFYATIITGIFTLLGSVAAVVVSLL